MKKIKFSFVLLLFLITIVVLPGLSFAQPFAPQPVEQTWVPVWRFGQTNNSNICPSGVSTFNLHQNGPFLSMQGYAGQVYTYNKKATGVIQIDSIDHDMLVDTNGVFQSTAVSNFNNCADEIFYQIKNSSGTFVLKRNLNETGKGSLYKDSSGYYVPVLALLTPYYQSINYIRDAGNGNIVISGGFDPTSFGLPINSWAPQVMTVTYNPVTHTVIPWPVGHSGFSVSSPMKTLETSFVNDTTVVASGLSGLVTELNLITKGVDSVLTTTPVLLAGRIERPVFFSKNNMYAFVAASPFSWDTVYLKHYDGLTWTNVPGFLAQPNANITIDYDPATQTLWTYSVRIHVPTGTCTVNQPGEADEYFGMYWNGVRYTSKNTTWLGNYGFYFGTYRDITPPGSPHIVAPSYGQTFTQTTTSVVVTGDQAYDGDTIKLYQGNSIVATTVADQYGDWTITLNSLVPNTYVFQASRTDPSGNEGQKSTVNFAIAEPNGINNVAVITHFSSFVTETSIELTCDVSLQNIILYNVAGQVVYKTTSKEKKCSIPVSKQNQLLFLHVQTDKGLIVKKIMH